MAIILQAARFKYYSNHILSHRENDFKVKNNTSAFREAMCVFYENDRFFILFYLMESKQYN